MLGHLAERLSSLFAGYSGAHNRFKTDGQDAHGKVSGRYVTVHSPPGIDQWENHLDGNVGLGIVPLLDDGLSVFWAAMDIDDRSTDHAALAKKIASMGLPLVVARSKSGGAHCYIFFPSPEPADEVIAVLASWVRALGVAKTELFPKQVRRIDSGDTGNALNMPYFRGDDSDRYAIDSLGRKLTVRQFCDLAESMTAPLSAAPTIEDRSELFPDGPPCLQFLEANGGFTSGTRNSCMFNVAIYLQKRGDEDCSGIDEINQTLCDDPLSQTELAAIVASVQKRSYEYTCKTPPLSSFCNRGQCLTRAYGVGSVATRQSTGNGSSSREVPWPMVSEVTLHQANDMGKERWYMTVSDRRFRLRTEEITSQTSLGRLFLSVFGKIPASISKKRFESYLANTIFADVSIVPPDETESDSVRFRFHIERFASQRAYTETIDGLKNGIPYAHDGHVWFHTETLIAYLSAASPDLARRYEDVVCALKEMGARKRTFRMADGKSIPAWGIAIPARETPQPAPNFSARDEF